MTALDLADLEERYATILSLTDRSRRLLDDLEQADPMRAEYRRTRFVQIDDVLPPEPLMGLMTALLPIVIPIAQPVAMAHKPVDERRLTDGSRFRRLDPNSIRHPQTQTKMMMLFEKLGLTNFGEQLGARLTPLVRHIAGPLCYRFLFFQIYEEGDYISAHTDYHMGARVDAQFPVSFATVGGLRVLEEGFLRMRYDAIGGMNLLGPNMWHEVPPLLRLSDNEAPHRIGVCLRFTPEDGA